MKRTVFLGVALFALMAVGVYAQTTSNQQIGDFDTATTTDGKGLILTKYKGKGTVVTIPLLGDINGYKTVVSIGDGCFEGNTNITSVAIPGGDMITTIGKNAFNGCTKLTSVTFRGNDFLTTIGDNAFKGCSSLAGITLPATVKTIGVWALGDTGLTSITIPNGVTRLETHAFVNSTKLTSVTIPASVTFIGSRAFYNSPNLRSVTFAGSIPSSGFNERAFETVGDIRDKYLAAGGGAGTYTRPAGSNTWTKGASTAAPAAGTAGLAFDLINSGKAYSVKSSGGPMVGLDVVIPSTYNNLPVTEIAAAWFASTGISSVTIPASVTWIGNVAFSPCVNLKSVTFGAANIGFTNTSFPDGDLLNKYKAGGAGTYTLSGTTWTKK